MAPKLRKNYFYVPKRSCGKNICKKIHLLMEDSQLFQTLDLKLKIILIFQKIVFFQNQKIDSTVILFEPF